jgi:hypothetical protein
MVLSETISFITIFSLTIVFSVFAIVIKDEIWRVALKMMAALFWMVMAVLQFTYFGVNSALNILSLPYAIFGLLFVFAILHDFLSEKKDRIWKFPD